MTKISNQYSLTNILTADLANSRLGINNVSPTVALDVTGAVKFSSSVNSGNISIYTGGYPLINLGLSSANQYTFVFDNPNGNLLLQKNGSTKVTFTEFGYQGIGTSPATFLHVLGSNTTNRGQLCIQSNNVSNGARVTWYYDTFNSGEIGTTSSNFYATATNDFLFYASGAERMRIAGSGDIMFKDTSGNNVVYFTAGNPSLSFSYSVLNRTASSPMYWNSGTGQIGLNTSARRFKKDIVSITTEQTKIALLLNPVEYTRIETNEKEFGFIAEEVRDAGLSCFVPEIDGEALTIDYSKLSVFAIAMIKEQQKAIQELSAKVSLLENK